MKSLAALALFAAVAASPAAAQIRDGSFEKSGDGSGLATTGYCYFGQTCSVTDFWNGTGSGVIGVNSPAWPGVQGDGNYLGFVQGGGFFAQTFTADTTGVYTLSWEDAGRGAGGVNGPHAYTVTLGALVIGAGLTDGQTAAGQAFTGRTSLPFLLSAGQRYTLTYTGVANGDTTSFIDAVQLSAPGAVPEPATWATMMLGMGLVGAGLRRRTRATRVAHA